MRRASLCVCLLVIACGGSAREGTVEVRMDFARTDGFFSAPFPSDALRQGDGRINLRGFPNPNQVAMLGAGLQLLSRDARGFAQAGGIFFQLSGAIDASRLPSLDESTGPDARVFVVAIDEGARDFMQRRPVVATFSATAAPAGAPNLLALLPLQGMPLRAKSTYAAVVLASLQGTDGLPLRQSDAMRELVAGRAPAGMADATAHLRALDVLGKNGVASKDIAGLTVFTTDDPVGAFRRAVDDALALPLPSLSVAPSRTDVFDDFCIYQGAIELPVFQEGTPPYSSTGGRWAVDASGHLLKQRSESARVFVTVPRRAAPAAGYPSVLMIRTGSGTDRALDRGVRDAMGRVLAPGTGPGLELARVGVAGISFDGPHGGSRNVSGGDEQFIMFNVFNPPALRDNVRQSALEAVLMAHVLEDVSFDASDCAGATSPVRFDAAHLALMGHSMGASIAPLALAVEPRFKAAVLSGAGGSWLANAVDKLKPLPTRASLEVLFGYTGDQHLTATDPTLTLVQWAPEAADTQVFARHLVDEPLEGGPRHVLMFQGIVDHYILPSIANTLTLSAGLDLAGPELDDGPAELAPQPKLHDVLKFSGRRAVPLPVRGNRDGTTAVVVQHAEDGVEDGHEVMFQLPAARAQYRRFLESWAAGEVPEVP